MTRTDSALDRLRRELEALARAVCPDIGPRPFYIVFTSDTPTAATTFNGCVGTASPHLAAAYRDAIGPRWRGPGPAVLVNDRALRATPRHTTDRRRRLDQLQAELADVMIHELAHVVTERWWGDAPSTPRTAPLARLAVEENFAPDSPGPDGRPDPHHGDRFTRVCLHLAYRARDLGWCVPDCGVIDPTAYGLSPVRAYAAALGAEPAMLAGLPLATLDAVPPPAAFQALYRADTDRHRLTTQTHVSVPPSPRVGAGADGTHKGAVAMSEAILDRVLAKRAKAKAEAANAFYALARDIGEGKEPKPDRLDAVLDAAGKTEADLRKAVATYSTRRALADKLASVASAEARKAQAEQALGDAAAELKAAEDKYAASTDPLLIIVRQTSDEIHAGSMAKGTLLTTCPYPALRERRDELIANRDRLLSEARELRTRESKALANKAERLALAERTNESVTRGENTLAASYLKEAEQAETRAANWGKEAASLEQQAATVQADIDAVEADMLKP